MSQSEESLDKSLLENAIHWFQPQFRQTLVNAIESEFPNYTLPRDIQAVLVRWEALLQKVQGWPGTPMSLVELGDKICKSDSDYRGLFKQIIYLYRRSCAARSEVLTEKTFHPELAGLLEREVKTLDALVNQEWFQALEASRLPRLKDFLPVKFIEAAMEDLVSLPARQYDEKFHILQTPALFLPDLAFFRAKCEVRDAPLAAAFVDIDDFKTFNSTYTETKVDRNLLPRFMQSIEAHVYHHGHAYRQGGDEYLILIPSMSRSLAIAFLEELRAKLSALTYPEIEQKTTVSIGLCIVEPDCPLTDRELRDRAVRAKNFAKKEGSKNCIATFNGPRFIDEELQIVKP